MRVEIIATELTVCGVLISRLFMRLVKPAGSLGWDIIKGWL